MDIQVSPPGLLGWRRRRVRCALGHGGLRPDKREGDGATPEGCFVLRQVMFRPDRLPQPVTGLPVRPLRRDDGWCDDPGEAAYNQLIRLPFSGRHEVLWRDDGVYDVLVTLGYNDDPVAAGRGSAIFLHVAGSDYAPTEGCVAVVLPDLLALLRDCDRNTRLCVRALSGQMKTI